MSISISGPSSQPLMIDSSVYHLDELHQEHIADENWDQKCIERRIWSLHVKGRRDSGEIWNGQPNDTNTTESGSHNLGWTRLDEGNVLGPQHYDDEYLRQKANI